MSIALTGHDWRHYRFDPRHFPTLDQRIDFGRDCFKRTFGSYPAVALVRDGQHSGRHDIIVRTAMLHEAGPMNEHEIAFGPILKR